MEKLRRSRAQTQCEITFFFTFTERRNGVLGLTKYEVRYGIVLYGRSYYLIAARFYYGQGKKTHSSPFPA
jgi:hypothetical protein